MNDGTLLTAFRAAYTDLYDAGDGYPGYNELITEGDRLIRERPELAQSLYRSRHDVISSDREVAALALACRRLET